MSADGSIDLNWGGEMRRFRLALGELRELQENINLNRKTPIGPWSLYQMISRGDAWPDELRAVIRLGLIGGGTRLELVPGLIKRYVEERPILESVPTAQAVLGTALLGDQSDQVGKKKTEAEEEATTEATTSLNSQQSTGPAPQSDSPLDKSINVPFGNSPPPSRDGIEPMVPIPMSSQ
jgi:hypothetical protein